MKDKNLRIERIYSSENASENYDIEMDVKNKKRPSWIKINLDKSATFIKILLNKEAFWYMRYFGDYFFPIKETREDYENYYDEISKEYDALVPHNKEIAKFIITKLKENNIKHEKDILEIGAGTGLVTEPIVAEGYNNITLLDLSQKCLDVAKGKNNLKKCRFVKADSVSFISDKKFSVIFSSMSLDYFNEEELKKILENIKSNLIKGGLFIAVDRHIYPLYERIFKKIEQGFFMLKTQTGSWRYDFFIGKK